MSLFGLPDGLMGGSKETEYLTSSSYQASAQKNTYYQTSHITSHNTLYPMVYYLYALEPVGSSVPFNVSTMGGVYQFRPISGLFPDPNNGLYSFTLTYIYASSLHNGYALDPKSSSITKYNWNTNTVFDVYGNSRFRFTHSRTLILEVNSSTHPIVKYPYVSMGTYSDGSVYVRQTNYTSSYNTSLLTTGNTTLTTAFNTSHITYG